MRPLIITISILFLSLFSVSAQILKLEGYKLLLSKYSFATETTHEIDTLNDNSFREYSYLFKNERQIIKIPRRIDKAVVYSQTSPVSQRRIRIDTVEQIEVHKIVDTINFFQLNELINSEIKIFGGPNKLKFDEAHFETIQANGKSSYTIDLQKPRIREGKHAFQKVSTLDSGGYLILHTIWFHNLKGERQEIECDIAWYLKYL